LLRSAFAQDARVYSNSDLGKKIENKPMDLFPGETFLIGNFDLFALKYF